MSRIRNIRSHYAHRVQKGRPSHEILDWAAAETHLKRFEILIREVPLAGKSLLDVGCGLGDLAGFLRDRKIEVDYTGVDIVEEMLQMAADDHPQDTFVQADVFADESPWAPGSFDVVFCSGTLNLNLGNNQAFLAGALPRMLELSREQLVVNMLHVRAGRPDPTYYHYDPVLAIEILKPFASEIRLVDDYLHNDFTLVARPKTP